MPWRNVVWGVGSMIWGSKKGEKAGKGQAGNAVEGAAAVRHRGSTASRPLNPEEAQRWAAIADRRSKAFAQAVLVLMGSRRHTHLSLRDLQWAVLPAVATGQLRIAE